MKFSTPNPLILYLLRQALDQFLPKVRDTGLSLMQEVNFVVGNDDKLRLKEIFLGNL